MTEAQAKMLRLLHEQGPAKNYGDGPRIGWSRLDERTFAALEKRGWVSTDLLGLPHKTHITDEGFEALRQYEEGQR